MIYVSREQLSGVAEQAARIAARDGFYSNVLIVGDAGVGIRVSASDGTIMARWNVPARVTEPVGPLLVSAALLVAALGQSKAEEIEIAIDGDHILLHGGTARSRLAITDEAEYFLAGPQSPQLKASAVDGAALAGMLAALIPFGGGPSSYKPIHGGVSLWIDNGHIRGACLASGATRAADAQIDALVENPWSGYLSIDSVTSSALAILKTAPAVSLSVAGGSLVLASDAFTLSLRLMTHDSAPDDFIARFDERRRVGCELRIDAREWIAALRRAQPTGAQRIIVTLDPGEEGEGVAVRSTAQGAAGELVADLPGRAWSFDGMQKYNILMMIDQMRSVLSAAPDSAVTLNLPPLDTKNAAGSALRFECEAYSWSALLAPVAS